MAQSSPPAPVRARQYDFGPYRLEAGTRVRATIALAARQPEDAVRSLEPAAAGELGLVVPFEYGMALPVYLRGLAHAAAGRDDEARREFARIESRPGLLKNSLIRPLAAQASARLRPPQ